MRFSQLATLSCALVLAAARLSAQTLLHYYDFNSGSVTDLVGSANATLNNGATITNGKVVFDGVNDSATFTTHLIPTSGAFTVAFLAKAPTTFSGYREIIAQGSSGTGFYIGTADANFRLTDAWGAPGIAYPTDGLEHHYALTFDGTTARFYIDGSVVGTHAGIAVGAGGGDTVLGNQFAGYSEYFAGSVDELRIYSGALSAGQIAGVISAIPEPSTTAALLGCSTLILLALRRRAVASIK